MNSRKRLAVGSVLAVIGALALVLLPSLNLIPEKSPWDFMLGFAVGITAGLGTALAIYGLLEIKSRNE